MRGSRKKACLRCSLLTAVAKVWSLALVGVRVGVRVRVRVRVRVWGWG